MSLLAIVSIAGIILAFNNSNGNVDAYANITATVDRTVVELEIEIDKDDSSDTGLKVVDSDTRVGYFTITVAGLPSYVDRGVAFNPQVEGGIATIELVEFNQEQGTSRFKVTGQNGGQANILFTTVAGARELYVTVKVNLTAKYVNLSKDAHFGAVAGAELDLHSSDSLAKLTFYAHKDDINHYYKPTNYELSYDLKESYAGVNLTTDDVLQVGDSARTDCEIYALARVPAMTEPVSVPIYLFKPLGSILIESNAFRPVREDNVIYYDLILNRNNEAKDRADFAFTLDNFGIVGQNYDFIVQSADSSMVSVNDSGLPGNRTLYATRNLGETVVQVTAYPSARMTVNGVPNQLVWFDTAIDKNVQSSQDIYVRVRNEFRDENELLQLGQMRFNVSELNAYFYQGAVNPYSASFAIDTVDSVTINYDNKIEFELLVEDKRDVYTGLYTKDTFYPCSYVTDSAGNTTLVPDYHRPGATSLNTLLGSKVSLQSILDINTYNEITGKWQSVWDINDCAAHYRNRFKVAFLRSVLAEQLAFDDENITMWLRAKSSERLSTSTAEEDKYAICSIPLKAMIAIDRFRVENTDNKEIKEIAMVYSKQVGGKPMTVNVYGHVNSTGNDSKDWSAEKVIQNTNISQLPFNFVSTQVETLNTPNTDPDSPDIPLCTRVVFTLSVDAKAEIEYYVAYPFTLNYPNGVSYTIDIKVYPYASEITMTTVEGNKRGNGVIYKEIKDPDDPEYIRTVYVRIGTNYRLNVDTPGVSVGAGAQFVYYEATGETDEEGNEIQKLVKEEDYFDAAEEGLFAVRARLYACNNDVFSDPDNPRYTRAKMEFIIYIVVVNPVWVVIPDHQQSTSTINLKNINDTEDVTLYTEMYKNVAASPNAKLCIKPVLENENVAIENLTVEGFTVRARYLTGDTVKLGFSIYKIYDFRVQDEVTGEWTEAGYDLNGNHDYSDDYYEVEYIKGTTIVPIGLNAEIHQYRPVHLISYPEVAINEDVVLAEEKLGEYIAVYTDKLNNEATTVAIKISPDEDYINYSQVGIALARWRDGHFDLDNIDYRVGEAANLAALTDENDAVILSATLTNNAQVVITPTAITSMGEYALVIYALDSMRLINGVVKPDAVVNPNAQNSGSCLITPLYIGTEAAVRETVKNLTNGAVHDANSGQKNNRGGYNWVIPASDKSQNATLFFTPEGTTYISVPVIQANWYYLDDLYTVLGWPYLKNATKSNINQYTLYCNDVDITKYNLKPYEIHLENDEVVTRYYILVDEPISGGNTVYRLVYGADEDVMTFYIVPGLKNMEVLISKGTGLHANKTLTPNKVEPENVVKVQRNDPFFFYTSLDATWRVKCHDVADTESSNDHYLNADLRDNKYYNNNLSYRGGKYVFTPEITLDGKTFVLTGLQTTVQVNVDGGIKSKGLNIEQSEVTITGSLGAVYNITVEIDRPWDDDNKDMLDYWFVYNRVSYPLFGNKASAHISHYEKMEGGNAGFYFTLTHQGSTKNQITGYYTHHFTVEVAIIIEATAINPFRNINSAQLIVRENLDKYPLKKNIEEDSAYLNVLTQSITNVSFKHFANTTTDKQTGDLIVPVNQTDSNFIYIDNSVSGGVLRIYPTPYFVSVDSIEVKSSTYTQDVVVGKDLTGKDIVDQVKYQIGFTQLIYNRDTKTYQTFLSGGSYKMVSSWSAKGGYQWDGVYYIKTYLKYNGQATKRLADGTKFVLTVTVDSYGHTVTENMTLYARYKDGIVVTPSTDIDTQTVGTMSMTQYQALGTSATYDVAFPDNYYPNYLAYTLHGNGVAYANISVNGDTKTVSVQLSSNTLAINSRIEIRIPYKAQGDFADPYLSVIIVPVYFQVTGFEFDSHPEYPLQISSNGLGGLSLHVLANYNAYMSLTARFNKFNMALNTSDYVTRATNDLGNGLKELTIDVPYTYENGEPVITEIGDLVRRQTFVYRMVNPVTTVETMTVYQAINSTKTYFTGYKNCLVAVSENSVTNGWSATINSSGDVTVELNYVTALVGKTLTLNLLSTADNEIVYVVKVIPTYGEKTVYQALGLTKVYDLGLSNLNGTYTMRQDGVVKGENEQWNWDTTVTTDGKVYIKFVGYDESLINSNLSVDVYSIHSVAPVFTLNIVPVYFTFDGYKLQKYPVSPLIALTTPFKVVLEAANLEYYEGSEANNMSTYIQKFNRTLNDNVTFKPVIGDISNFYFDNNTRELSRNGTVVGTSYLAATANWKYYRGEPIFVSSTDSASASAEVSKITTLFTVKTYGTGNNSGGNDDNNLEHAPKTRVLRAAQAIGTQCRYNIALSGVRYDQTLDKTEITVTTSVVYTNWKTLSHPNWDAYIEGNEVVVDLDLTTLLYANSTMLKIDAYRSEDGTTPVYTLYITPALVTIESLYLENHGEKPLLFEKPNAATKETLDDKIQAEPLYFTYNYAKVLDTNPDYQETLKAQIDLALADFCDNYLNVSTEVIRATETIRATESTQNINFLTLTAGLKYVNGLPKLDTIKNPEAILVQTSHEFKVVDQVHKPKNRTEAQAIGETVTYELNLGSAFAAYDVRYEQYDKSAHEWKRLPASDVYQKDVTQAGVLWSIDAYSLKAVTISLKDSTALFGEQFRIAYYWNELFETPEFVFNIVPVYFSVEQLLLDGQSSTDVWILYPDTVETVEFTSVTKGKSSQKVFNSDAEVVWDGVDAAIAAFNQNLKATENYNYIKRTSYDPNATAGQFRAFIYVYYNPETGVPALSAAPTETSYEYPLQTIFCVNTLFTYKIYGEGEYPPNYPHLPNASRLRTEYQAIGLEARYTIDLSNDVPVFSAQTVKVLAQYTRDNAGITAKMDGNIVVVTLAPKTELLKKNIVLELSSIFDTTKPIFILTIKPVLYEIDHITVYGHSETPLCVATEEAIDNLSYRIAAKHYLTEKLGASGSVISDGEAGVALEAMIAEQVRNFNNSLGGVNNQALFEHKTTKTGTVLIRSYLTVRAAFDYVNGYPVLADLNQNPTKVISTTMQYNVTDVVLNEATYVQMVYSTEPYTIDKLKDYASKQYYLTADGISNSGQSNIVADTQGLWRAQLTDNRVNVSIYGGRNMRDTILKQVITLKIREKSEPTTVVFTLTIHPALFTISRWEVLYHTEHPLWIVAPEKIDDLRFNAQVKYSPSLFPEEIKSAIAEFNDKMTGLNETGTNEAGVSWQNLIEVSTVDSEYLTANAAVRYVDGIPEVVSLRDGNYTTVVSTVYQYKMYSGDEDLNGSGGNDIPDGPRSWTPVQAIGLTKKYTVDLPNLPQISSINLQLKEKLPNDTERNWDSYLENSWKVDIVDGQLAVQLAPDPDLVNRRLVINIYAGTDRYEPDFVLNIDPVWFVVTGLQVVGHPEDPITRREDDDTEGFVDSFKYRATAEYSKDVLGAKDKLNEFNAELAKYTNTITSETSLIKTTGVGPLEDEKYDATEDDYYTVWHYYYTATTAIAYNDCRYTSGHAYGLNAGEAVILDPTTAELTFLKKSTYEVLIDPNWDGKLKKTANMALGEEIHFVVDLPSAADPTKNYEFDEEKTYATILDDEEQRIDPTQDGFYWSFDEEEVTVNVSRDIKRSLIGKTLEIKLYGVNSPIVAYDEKGNPIYEPIFYLQIQIVWFKVDSFGVTSHSETPLRLYPFTTTADVEYYVITNDLPDGLIVTTLRVDDDGKKITLQREIDAFNQSLNANRGILVSETLKKQEIKDADEKIKDIKYYIELRAAINYRNGLPIIGRIGYDTRNVVEKTFEYITIPDDRGPEPKHPPVMGLTTVRQAIGIRLVYNLSNVSGNIYYKNIWVDGAGDLVYPFNARKDMAIDYELVNVICDEMNDKLYVELKPNKKLLTQKVEIYVPYTVEVDGEEIWRSHCIEITPVLFDVYGWNIDPHSFDGDTTDPKVQTYSNYINLGTAPCSIDEPLVYQISFIPLITICDEFLEDEDYLDAIAALTSTANSRYGMQLTVPYKTKIDIKLETSEDGSAVFKLYKYVFENSTNIVKAKMGLSYINGIPVADIDGTVLTSDIIIYTGVVEPWPPGGGNLGSMDNIAFQAIGTPYTYTINIPYATQILPVITEVDLITGTETETQTTLDWSIDMNNGLGLFDVTLGNYTATSIDFNVDLQADMRLIGREITIKIPYLKIEDPKDPTDKGTLYIKEYIIRPVLFKVIGFTLDGYNNNLVTLEDDDVVPVKLKISAERSEKASIRNDINLAIQNLETEINSLINAGSFKWQTIAPEGISDVNVAVSSSGGQLVMTKINNVTGDGRLQTKIGIYCSSEGSLTTKQVSEFGNEIPVDIIVRTKAAEDAFFPGFDKCTAGDEVVAQQAIGTPKAYNFTTDNADQTFYFEYLEARNAGSLRQDYQYELIDIKWVGDAEAGTITVTTIADTQRLTNPFEILIPYTEIVNGQTKWYYYTLKIEPVLFEVEGWGLEKEDDIVNWAILDDAAVELKFKAKIRSASLATADDERIFSQDDLRFINNAIDVLEEQLNQYDTSNGGAYKNLTINNTPQEGSYVNYVVYRDDELGKLYLMRDLDFAAKTVMQVTVAISYQTNAIDSAKAHSAQPIIGYAGAQNENNITDTIDVITTSTEDEEIIIVQNNAYLLAQLQPNTKYILMEDISLAKIFDGTWTPAAFPNNAQLNGNNYKIFLDCPFNLSGLPSNVGIFTSIPAESVIKNVQVVLPAKSTRKDVVWTHSINLENYSGGSVNIGTLAGINNGIITNCAVLSEWQFMLDGSGLTNWVEGKNLSTKLKYNPQGYLFDDEDDQYFYEIAENDDGSLKLVNIYNKNGERYINLDGAPGKEKITPDRANVAKYEGHSTMTVIAGDTDDDADTGYAAGRLLVNDPGKNSLSIILGGLVGTSTKMITNSRVLIDVEMDGPSITQSDGVTEKVSVASATVGGVLGNNTGIVTSSYFSDGNVINNANAGNNSNCYLGGFCGINQANGVIMQSYAMGKSTGRANTTNHTATVGTVKTVRNLLGGFVHQNAGTVRDCMVNMVIEKLGKGAVGGFVYKNTSSGTITNCISNDKVVKADQEAQEFYRPFVVLNDTMVDITLSDTVYSTKGLSNLKYAGERSYSFVGFSSVLTWMGNNLDSTSSFDDITAYAGYSMGDANETLGVSDKNTIWRMTNLGPALREANDIAISFRRSQSSSSNYLYAPGSEHNPYLIANQEQFRRYVYGATPTATVADKNETEQNIEANRQTNHLRLIDNFTLQSVPDTYKIIYAGTLEGNGLNLNGINLPYVSLNSASIGLFAKTEYATIRNINFSLSGAGIYAPAMRYVGGIAGIAINSSFVDVTITGGASAILTGANIVGGIAGIAVITDPKVENYNVTSSVSVKAERNPGVSSQGDSLFSSGLEYTRQTLYAVDTKTKYEQAFGTAGGIYGFITSNPNNYRIVNDDGTESIVARTYANKNNQDASILMKDSSGNTIDDINTAKYYSQPILLQKLGGSVKNVTANVAGGLIGIMDTTIELRDAKLTGLTSLTGKYYLGGLVGINLGKISGGSINLSSFNVDSSVNNNVNSNFIYRAGGLDTDPVRFWGMTIGGVAAYNDGMANTTLESGVIENVRTVNVDVLNAKSPYIYVIGGVVGVNGEHGKVVNTVNAYYPETKTVSGITTTNLLLSSANVSKIGYYFGNIVGRGNINIDIDTGMMQTMKGFNASDMELIQMPIDWSLVTEKNYVSREDFKTPYWRLDAEGHDTEANAFGITATTNKVQTLTMAEYQQYILTKIANSSIVNRVKALEMWYRSLPTEETINVETVNGRNVAVEKVKPDSLTTFKNWIKNNNLLPTKMYEQYEKYIDISATGESVEWLSDSDNLMASRQERFAMAIEFFTYKDRSGPNADFTWDDYMTYCYILDRASTLQNYTGIENEDFIANWAYPSGKLGAYYTNDQEVKETVTIEDMRNMRALYTLAQANTALQFTEKDPLQGYINYIVGGYTYTDASGVKRTHATKFARGTSSDSWVMTLPQYYYYAKVIKDMSFGARKYVYTAEEYADYLYANYVLKNANDKLITLEDYIEFVRQNVAKVVSYEQNWLIEENGGTTSADNTTLGWWTGAGTTEKNNVKVADYIIYYDPTNTNDPQNASCKTYNVEEYYLYSRANQGLDFVLYEQIRQLGGSLYELHDITKYKTATSYVFALKTKQYDWTTEQRTFIEKYYTLDNIKFALSATFYGDILSNKEIENARTVNVERRDGLINWIPGTPAQVVGSDDISDLTNPGTWLIDKGVIGTYDLDTDTLGDWYLPVDLVNNTYYTIDEVQYKVVNKHNIDLRAIYETVEEDEENEEDEEEETPAPKMLKGPALYIDKDGDKIFNRHRDKLLLYQVYSVTEADFERTNEQGETEYYAISRAIVQTTDDNGTITSLMMTTGEQEHTGNCSDYLEEGVWWLQQGFKAEHFDTIKHRALRVSIDAEKAQVHVTEIDENGDFIASRGTGLTVADDWDCALTNEHDIVLGWSGFKNEQKPNEFTPEEYAKIVAGASYGDDMVWYSAYADYKMFSNLYLATVFAPNITQEVLRSYVPASSAYKYPFSTESNSAANNFAGLLVPDNILADAIYFNDSEKLAYLAMAEVGGTVTEYVTWAQNNVIPNQVRNYFRLNHYIYYKAHNLTASDLNDFVWALTEENVRSEIYYEGINAETKTSDLMTYRAEWYNAGGVPYMTFRDYCEWINVYAYNTSFTNERGDIATDANNPDGNNASATLTAESGWLSIYSYAVWKRMEKYESNTAYINGQTSNSGIIEITAPILKRQISTTIFPKIYSSGLASEVGKQPTLPSGRHTNDQYEYNEKYTIVNLGIERKAAEVSESVINNAYELIPTSKYSQECNCSTNTCKNPNHLSAIAQKWYDRYGLNANGYLYLDEANGDTASEYVQLYIPYEYFSKAAIRIKAYYCNEGDTGYDNFMRYWAKNGSYTWIGSIEECPNVPATSNGYVMLEYTYASAPFWNRFDGTTNPLNQPDSSIVGEFKVKNTSTNDDSSAA